MVEEKNSSYVLKIILLGDSAVGKTSIAQVYVNDSFKNSYKSTIGLDILYKKIILEDKDNDENLIFDLQIFDFSGHSYFKKMRKTLMNSSHAAVLIFDVSRESTFSSLEEWLEDMKVGAGNIPYILACNKYDLDAVVKEEDIKIFAEKKGVEYIKTSAKENQGLDETFKRITENVAKKNGWINVNM